MTEQIHYREPKALRMHTEQLEKGIRRSAKQPLVGRRVTYATFDEDHTHSAAQLGAATPVPAIEGQQR